MKKWLLGIGALAALCGLGFDENGLAVFGCALILFAFIGPVGK